MRVRNANHTQQGYPGRVAARDELVVGVAHALSHSIHMAVVKPIERAGGAERDRRPREAGTIV
jgi:hypothetical protein